MKKFKLRIMGLFMALLLCGCSLLDTVTGPSVEWMGNWSFQKNEGTNEYILFFALKDSRENEISAEVNVDVRIVNDADETVYEGEHFITEQDFGTYTSKLQGDHYLAAVRIPAAEVKCGRSANGTVYFTVYQDNGVSFDETNCEAFSCLPILDYEIQAEELPVELDCCSYDGSVQSQVMITQVKVEEKGEFVSSVSVVVLGEKTYDREYAYDSQFDTFTYKLCDAEGYVVDTGTVFLKDLEVGDKFREELLISYDLIPGEAYTIRFSSAD